MKSRRFLVCSDIHGDMQDPEAVKALRGFCADFRPQIRVVNGDLWDFRNLRKGASDEEKAGSLEDDWQAGNDFAESFFEDGEENYFLRGNHDERIYHFSRSCVGLMRDYANDGIKRLEANVRKWRAKMLPYDSALGVLKLGKLSIVHGYHAGVNAAAMHARVYGNVLFGHVHSIEVNAIASLEPAEARGIGCLCRRDLDYINAKTAKLRWSQGWAYGLLFADGSYTLSQARKINGKFVCATNYETY